VQLEGLVPETVRDLLTLPVVGVVGTLRAGGAVKLTPVWFELDGDRIRLNGHRGAHWLDHVERTRSATLLVVDPSDAYRSAHLELALEEVTTVGAGDHLDALSLRYRGRRYEALTPVQRVIVTFVPESVRYSAGRSGAGTGRRARPDPGGAIDRASDPAAPPRPVPPAERSRRVAALFDEVAATYDRGGVAWFGPIAERLVAQLAAAPGERALDLGCGRGAATFPLARAVGAHGRVTAVDLSAAMVELTAKEASAAGYPQIEVVQADVAASGLPSGTYDVAVASFVLFFMPAPLSALREWRELLVPGGRLGISTFGEARAGFLGTSIESWLGLAGGQDAAGRPALDGPRVAELMVKAGFEDVSSQDLHLSVTFCDLEHWYSWSWSHGQRGVWQRLPAAEREAAKTAVAERLEEHRGSDGSYRVPARIGLVTGFRPPRG
jgi:ubiquinone/menaquinone biosynthesis C-methylase UbiE